MAPFAGYEDFSDCIRQNKGKKKPAAYCATIMRQVEVGKALGGNVDEELVNIEPVEVSLTIAPMVKEDFLMTKSAVKFELKAEDIHEIAKSLGLEPEEVSQEEVKQALKTAAAVIEKAMPPQLAAALEGNKDKKKPDDDDEDEEEAMMKAISGASADVKKALAAAHGILAVHKSKLPTSLVAVLKAFDKAKKADPSAFEEADVKKSATDMIEIFKSQFPGVVEAIVEPVQKQLTDANKTIQAMQDARELDELRELAKSMPIQGEPDQAAQKLLGIKKALSPEQWEDFVKDQQAIYAQVSKSSLFNQVSGRSDNSGTATDRMLAKAKELVQKSAGKSSIEEAITLVASEYPQLYSEYLAEQRESAIRQGR